MPAPPKRPRGGDGRSKPPDEVVCIVSSDDEDSAAAAPVPQKRRTTQAPASKRRQPAAPGGAASGGGRGAQRAKAAAGGGSSGKQLKLNFQPQSKGLASLLLSPTPSSQGAGAGSAPSSQQQQQQQQQQQLPVAGTSKAREPSPAHGAAAAEAPRAMWVDSHAPARPDQLAVHAKKVLEVRAWLEGYQIYRDRGTRAWVLLVTGPPGCGKSTTVRVVAQDMGFEVLEWQAPTPTLWSDVQYQGAAGLQYMSKLDDFDAFVAHSKLSLLPLARPAAPAGSGGSVGQAAAGPAAQEPQQQQPGLGASAGAGGPQGGGGQGAARRGAPLGKLLLLDDLPYVGDAERRARLIGSLRTLCLTCRCPVVLVTTESSGGGGGGQGARGGGYGGGDGGGMGAMGGHTKGLHKDVVALLDSLGAATITFNPVTALALAKALSAMAAAEGFELSQQEAAAIAQAADGDLRNAVQSLQVYSGGQPRATPAPPGRGGAAGKARKRGAAGGGKGKQGGGGGGGRGEAAGAEQRRIVGRVARDTRLSLYHALGKLLHNKRDTEAAGAEAAGAAAGAAAAAADGAQPKPKRQRRQQQHGGGTHQRGPAWEFLGQACELEPLEGFPPIELREDLRRPPMRYDPEAILQQSALDAPTVAAFLAENYPTFISDGAMDDLAAAARYLSDAGFLAHRRNTAASTAGFWDEGDAVSSTLQSAAAVSVAARGLLFANAHPAPSSWQPLRGPTCYLPDRAAAENLEQLSAAARRARLALGGAALLAAGGAHAATRALPFVRALSRAPSHAWLAAAMPTGWTYIWQGALSRSEPAAGAAAAAAEAEARALAVSLAAAGLVDGGGGGGGGAGGLVSEEAEDEIEED